MERIASPRTDDGGIEQEIKAKGLTHPRVAPADIEANIFSECYFTAAEGVAGSAVVGERDSHDPTAMGSLSLLTFCVLVLRNGFTVTGESACASPENFDAEIGKRIARQNAVQKVWPLMGYELRTRLHAAQERQGHLTKHMALKRRLTSPWPFLYSVDEKGRMRVNLPPVPKKPRRLKRAKPSSKWVQQDLI